MDGCINYAGARRQRQSEFRLSDRSGWGRYDPVDKQIIPVPVLSLLAQIFFNAGGSGNDQVLVLQILSGKILNDPGDGVIPV